MYPPIAPPTVQVTCKYPGASAQVVAETVAAPIEQQVNGVENMMYMSSQCTNDGTYNLTVTFKHGVDLNLAQVLVQNRVAPGAAAAARRHQGRPGVTTRKQSPDILMAIGIYSPDGRYDQLYLSNYALMHVQDELARAAGRQRRDRCSASATTACGSGSTRTSWPSRNMTAGDVVARHPRAEPAGRRRPDRPAADAARASRPRSRSRTLGRLIEPEQFENIIVKTTPDGRIVRLKDVGRVELGAKNQDISSKVDGKPVGEPGHLPAARRQRPGHRRRRQGQDGGAQEGLPARASTTRSATTPRRSSASRSTRSSRRCATRSILVALVVLLFLQNWRSAIIPLIAVPVAIVGTFAVMAGDGLQPEQPDAVRPGAGDRHRGRRRDRGRRGGRAPHRARADAARRHDQGDGARSPAPVIAVGLVLSAVFVPCAFICGITGQFFRQFALTIAVSTVISTFNSLTLSPALAALLLRAARQGDSRSPAAAGVSGRWGAGLGWQYLGPLAGAAPGARTLAASAARGQWSTCAGGARS